MSILITGGNGNLASILKKSLKNFTIFAPNRNDLDLTDQKCLDKFFENNKIDIIIHTAIKGGRRTVSDPTEIVYQNLLMFENIIRFSDKVNSIINLDSGAIYNRESDIFNRKETDIRSIPTDAYGFSKYVIYQRSLAVKNVYNLRIFGLFHQKEEPNRFIKACFIAKFMNKTVDIYDDKYFDFFYEDDFVSVVNYYIKHSNSPLPKTINLCYNQKYRLSEIFHLIEQTANTGNTRHIIHNISHNNYCGDSSLLYDLDIPMNTLTDALSKYANNFQLTT